MGEVDWAKFGWVIAPAAMNVIYPATNVKHQASNVRNPTLYIAHPVRQTPIKLAMDSRSSPLQHRQRQQ